MRGEDVHKGLVCPFGPLESKLAGIVTTRTAQRLSPYQYQGEARCVLYNLKGAELDVKDVALFS